LERTRDLMDSYVRDCLVEGYEPLIESITLLDLDDRHVLAAASTGEATLVVTFNLRDFPEAALRPYGVEAWHPDAFVVHLMDLGPHLVCAAAREHRASLRHPPKTAEEYFATLERQGLPQTVARLREYETLI
jgi:hypothetical protein